MIKTQILNPAPTRPEMEEVTVTTNLAALQAFRDDFGGRAEGDFIIAPERRQEGSPYYDLWDAVDDYLRNGRGYQSP